MKYLMSDIDIVQRIGLGVNRQTNLQAGARFPDRGVLRRCASAEGMTGTGHRPQTTVFSMPGSGLQRSPAPARPAIAGLTPAEAEGDSQLPRQRRSFALTGTGGRCRLFRCLLLHPDDVSKRQRDSSLAALPSPRSGQAAQALASFATLPSLRSGQAGQAE